MPTDMKLTPEDKKEREIEVNKDMEEYPWGLGLDLDESSLEKLGVDFSELGQEVTIIAKAKVTNIHSSASENHSHHSVGLQITHMDIDAGSSDKMAERIGRLYKDE